jgi:RNA polymerase sigma factor (sigma-70 family)
MSEQNRPGRVPPEGAAGDRVTRHLWLAEAVAREFAWLAPKTIDGDVLQPAYEGLVKADRGFVAGKGDFVAYARKWIIGEIFKAVDRQAPGFVRRYGPAASLFDEEGEEEGADEGMGEVLDHAALAMCIGSESARRAFAEPNGLRRVLDEELSRLPPGQRAVFLGWGLDGMTWEELAAGAGISVSTAKRWVGSVQRTLAARLSGR